MYKILYRNKGGEDKEEVESYVDLPSLGIVTLEAILSAGEFGYVFRGKWNGHDVVIKTANFNEFGALSKVLFYRERVLHALSADRTNVVPKFFGAGEVEINRKFVPCFVMEYIHGFLLSEVAADSELEFYFIAKAVLEAVVHLHAARLVHRDLKPNNLMLEVPSLPSAISGDVRVRIFDLGLAAMFESDFRFECEGRFVFGSKGFVPPEIKSVGFDYRQYDSVKRDLFAVGMILRRLCVDSYVPEVFVNFINRLLAVPGERFRAAEEALEVLERLNPR